MQIKHQLCKKETHKDLCITNTLEHELSEFRDAVIEVFAPAKEGFERIINALVKK